MGVWFSGIHQCSQLMQPWFDPSWTSNRGLTQLIGQHLMASFKVRYIVYCNQKSDTNWIEKRQEKGHLHIKSPVSSMLKMSLRANPELMSLHQDTLLAIDLRSAAAPSPCLSKCWRPVDFLNWPSHPLESLSQSGLGILKSQQILSPSHISHHHWSTCYPGWPDQPICSRASQTLGTEGPDCAP